MGGKQSTQENFWGGKKSTQEKIKQEILNNTDIQMKLKKVNDTINKTAAKVINEVSDEMDVKSNTTMKQKAGNLSLSGVSGSKNVKLKFGQSLDKKSGVNITSVQNIKQDSKVVSDLQKQLQTDLKNSITNKQESSKTDGEQMMKELMGAITDVVGDTVQSLTGGESKSSKEIENSIKNNLKISNDKELINKTENILSSEMITKNLTKLSTELNTYLAQEVGDVNVDNIKDSEDVALEVMQSGKVDESVFMEKVNNTGMGSEILSKFLDIDKTEIDDAIETAQVAEETKKATLESAGEGLATAYKGAGDAISSAASGVSQGLGSVLNASIMPLIIIGVVGIGLFFLARPLLSKGMDKMDNGSMPGAMPFKLPPIGKLGKIGKMKGGSIIKKSSKILENLYTMIKKYVTIKNSIIVLLLVLGYNIIKILKVNRSKENFNMTENANKNFNIKINDKYFKRENGNITLVDKKEDSSKITLIKKNDKYFLNFGYTFSLTNLNNNIKILPNKPIFYKKQEVVLEDDKLKLGGKFVSLKDNKISFDGEPAKVLLE